MSKPLAFMLLVALFRVASPGQPSQGAAQSAQVKSAQPGAVSGRVIDAATGNAVERATVLLNRTGAQAQLTAVTDSGGRFAFPTVEPGAYVIGAVRAGFAVAVEAASQGPGGKVRIAVAPAAKVADLKLRLTPEAVISGRVTDEAGDPLPGVSVRLMHPVYVNGQRQLQRIEAIIGVTNDRGEYRIFDLVPGRYYVVATGGNAGAAFDRAFPVFYPGAADPSGATMFVLKPGIELRDTNFTLLPARLARLRGRVVDAGGQPVSGARVLPAPKGSAFSAASSGSGAVSNAAGEWEINGAWPGPYYVTADVSRGQERRTARVSVILPPTGLTDIVLRVTPGAEVAGTLRLEGEQGRADFNPAQMRVMLRAQEYDAGLTTGAVMPDGRFTFRTVRPAGYSAAVSPLPESLYLKSVRFDKEESINTGFEAAEPRGYALELVLSGDGAQLSGAVRDKEDKPCAGATVVLVPADPALRRVERLYKTATTMHDGSYTLQGIPPGEYRLYAWEEIEPGVWFEPDFLLPYAKSGVETSLAAGDRKKADLKLATPVEAPAR